ncbi:bifunctional DNA-formamidopyrimidine glycosylase/DNA-(apurinic or apyrimidinic site) lyase [Ferrovibrio sp.]|uniref:bifunctional DNA-formamidopyrimidine glycosylase/DNA-(apurinic or apyrimidinic site) lyase n=1 Tax=Ferrovibrio sp. TaxID=1917215 RepID=UPI001B6C7532|nr:bifunctional DNA-formamidopyrimidine glycosylase/DNA-(apurinic or apyrimidinic site) lyase [Ferrovibrio sp.]MBP7062534.1 bifunctional DNA-formamidopyrimidine glycosylase/DNA-(apurinic or apyrimidinic site) lyase [Ferrovibrio sp.]
MPELPEVETTRRGLALKLQDRRITRIEARRPDLRFPLPADFAARIRDRQVEALERRAKYILLRLSGGLVWLIHLGMSGRMVIRQGWPNDIGPHDHVIFGTDDGWSVTFNDARRFGMMDLIEAPALAGHKLLGNIGPEPLDDAFTPAVLIAALHGKRTPMKAALLDQRVVAGLGNIYVSEALYRAGIHPERLAGSVAPKRLEKLVPAIKDVLLEAVEAGGSSLRDYVQTNGELGYFQTRFRVYDREDQPCHACQRPIKRIVQSGRSTFFCGHCQK